MLFRVLALIAVASLSCISAEGQLEASGAVKDSPSTGCPTGYSFDVDHKKCYKAYPSPTTYTQANSTCAQDGARIVHIHNAFENSMLAGMSGGDMWIGLRCNGNSPSDCIWDDDGTNASSYSNFLRGPDLSVGRCVMMYGSTGKWGSYDCDSVHEPFACEKPGCLDDWTYFNDNCYQVFVRNVSMYNTQAERLCNSYSAQLASIHSKEENDTILGLMTTIAESAETWIDLRRVGSTSTFEWMDGSAWDYSNFYSNRPTPYTTWMWGAMCFDGFWTDEADIQFSSVACKKPYNG